MSNNINDEQKMWKIKLQLLVYENTTTYVFVVKTHTKEIRAIQYCHVCMYTRFYLLPKINLSDYYYCRS